MSDTGYETGRGDVWVCASCGSGYEARDVGEAAALHDIETDDHAFVDADSRIVGEDPGYGNIGEATIAAAQAARDGVLSWQQANPGTCAGCLGDIAPYDPTLAPIHAGCRADLTDGDDRSVDRDVPLLAQEPPEDPDRHRNVTVTLTADERAFLLDWMRGVAKVTPDDTELAIAEKIGMALANIEIEEEGR